MTQDTHMAGLVEAVALARTVTNRERQDALVELSKMLGATMEFNAHGAVEVTPAQFAVLQGLEDRRYSPDDPGLGGISIWVRE